MIRIVESFFVKSAVEPKDYPASAYTEFAFAGRSNVGKSSLINLLTNKHLLAKISRTPGKTRVLNFFLIRWKNDDSGQQGFMQFTDFPGYGFAEVSQAEQEKWRIMIDKYLNMRQQLKGIFVLVDIRHPADPKDKTMLEMLSKRNIDFCVIATKADKIPKTKIKAALSQLAKQLDLRDKTIIATSAEKNIGIDSMLAWLEERLS
ncbi:MAG TPA: ribosome biogenesis GTP-binding protein YihA/YsxC [Candidatus Cloacimonadota bacterium]|nr:ribosome biogenesis GTP-binding protein YihA/YsxC [Candidatus Cloacimonadota bacterium]HOV16026.1 ribosome biogenesis GTP-binding protein YihA/YsxC [Candidatus Cloacimonadota bacterium]HQL14181.1 ribosome biogenesis GTP-binding protein YihA/YsxC [Candidatus Cloacimonadota bacterium]